MRGVCDAPQNRFEEAIKRSESGQNDVFHILQWHPLQKYISSSCELFGDGMLLKTHGFFGQHDKVIYDFISQSVVLKFQRKHTSDKYFCNQAGNFIRHNRALYNQTKMHNL